MYRRAFLVLVLVPWLSIGAGFAQDPTKVESTHYRLVLKTSECRLFISTMDRMRNQSCMTTLPELWLTLPTAISGSLTKKGACKTFERSVERQDGFHRSNIRLRT